MAAPYTHGATTVIFMSNANPPVTDWSADIHNSNLNRKRKVHSTTNYGATAEGRQGGLYDLSLDLEIDINATNHALLRTYNDTGAVYFLIQPFGTASGRKQYLVHGFFEDFPLEAKADDLVRKKVKVAIDGDWTESAQS